jgi:hypothetical protein
MIWFIYAMRPVHGAYLATGMPLLTDNSVNQAASGRHRRRLVGLDYWRLKNPLWRSRSPLVPTPAVFGHEGDLGANSIPIIGDSCMR